MTFLCANLISRFLLPVTRAGMRGTDMRFGRAADCVPGGWGSDRDPTARRSRYMVVFFDFSAVRKAIETLEQRFEEYCHRPIENAMERNPGPVPRSGTASGRSEAATTALPVIPGIGAQDVDGRAERPGEHGGGAVHGGCLRGGVESREPFAANRSSRVCAVIVRVSIRRHTAGTLRTRIIPCSPHRPRNTPPPAGFRLPSPGDNLSPSPHGRLRQPGSGSAANDAPAPRRRLMRHPHHG